ncbi:MAG: RNase H-like domain-containing protein, partial [Nitrososphaerales archaeon]
MQTDSSSRGIGSCLLQDGQPIAFASRALTETETRYAQCEKELLSIVYACEKFSHYIYGHPNVIIENDHKPLEPIFKKPISAVSPRLQRMLLRLLRFNFQMKYIPGEKLYLADTLSRAYLTTETKSDVELQQDLDVLVHTLINDFPASNKKLLEISEKTAADAELSKLSEYVRNGFPKDKQQMSSELKQYQKFAVDIYEIDGILFVHNKIIIPSSMRKEMLNLTHEGHLGIEKCKNLARACMYWPGLNSDIEKLISKCETCNKYRNNQRREPLIPHEIPDRPWCKLGADIFHLYGKDYLLVVDYFSKYPEIALLPDKTSNSVITQLKSIFARHGIPETLF